MRKHRIAVIDLVTKCPTKALYARIMHANLSSIMPQIVALWCEQESTTLPTFYINRIKHDLGPLWNWLPKEAIYHDPNAYLKSSEQSHLEKEEKLYVSDAP